VRCRCRSSIDHIRSKAGSCKLLRRPIVASRCPIPLLAFRYQSSMDLLSVPAHIVKRPTIEMLFIAEGLHHPWVSDFRRLEDPATKTLLARPTRPRIRAYNLPRYRVWNPKTSPASLELHILRFAHSSGDFPARAGDVENDLTSRHDAKLHPRFAVGETS
jgi:hypothetical protein